MLSMLPEYLFQERRVNCSLTEVGTFRWCSLLTLSPSPSLERERVCVYTCVCTRTCSHTGVHEHTRTYINTYTHTHTLSCMHSLFFSPWGEGDMHIWLPPHLFRKCFQDTWVYCHLKWAGRAQETPTPWPLSFRVEVGRQHGCKVLGLSPSSPIKKPWGVENSWSGKKEEGRRK